LAVPSWPVEIQVSPQHNGVSEGGFRVFRVGSQRHGLDGMSTWNPARSSTVTAAWATSGWK